MSGAGERVSAGKNPMRGDFESEEWEICCDLTAAHHLMAHFGTDDFTSTHLA